MTNLTQKTVTEKQTKVFRSFHGIQAETIRTEKGRTFSITTMKRYSGKLTTSATEVKAAENKKFLIMQHTNIMNEPFFTMDHGKLRATAAKVKECHFKALAAFDLKVNSIEFNEEVKAVYTPKIGDILFLNGYGKFKGSAENHQIIYKIEPTQFGINYHTIEKDTLILDVEDSPRDYKNLFGIGMYYSEGLNMQNFGITKDDLNNMLIEAQEVKKVNAANKIKEAEEAAKLRVIQVAELKKKFNYLTPITDAYNNNQAKKNLVTMLKKEFPTIKFSVTKSNHSTYNVNYTNGVPLEKVRSITDLFESYENDQTGDYRDYNPSLFNEVFGGFKYIFTTRHYSEEIKALKAGFIEKLNFDDWNKDMYWYQFLQTQTIPVNAKIKGIAEKPNFSGSVEESYFLEYEQEAEKETIKPIENKGLIIAEYSAKAGIIYGNTKPIKDKLKALGCRFNARLKMEGQTVMGWVFQLSKMNEIKTAFNL